jgi:hypothetical protein
MRRNGVTVLSLDVCGLDKDPGPCPGTVMRWYYDQDSDTCAQFVYGGCQGNANRFRTQAECISRCIDLSPGTTGGGRDLELLVTGLRAYKGLMKSGR